MEHSILFSGHMIDEKDRQTPRFPVNKENEVRTEILNELINETNTNKNQYIGIAGGACGGDIIFHELCEEIGIKSEMYLALPIEEFKNHSVSFAGKEWEDRYDMLIKKIPIHILSIEKRRKAQNDLWNVTNSWMLEKALEIGSNTTKLLALWDGKKGNKNGGTEQMIEVAKKMGVKIKIINITKI